MLVDLYAGIESSFTIRQSVKELSQGGAAALYIDDLLAPKSCGYPPAKALVSKQELVNRIKAAVDARTDDTFMIIAKTNALASEGLDGTLERAYHCVEAGADAVYTEAMNDLRKYRMCADVVRVPLLADITGTGKSCYYTTQQLASAGVRMVLYPSSVFRHIPACPTGPPDY